MISYSGWKLFCTSTPRPFEGRSLICPIEAFTTKSLPRYLLIVFALAGDSTMTRFFAIPIWPTTPQHSFFYHARSEREAQKIRSNLADQDRTTAPDVRCKAGRAQFLSHDTVL